MASLVVPSGALLRCIWNAGGVPAAVNVYGVRNANAIPITQTLTNTIAAAIKAGFTSSTLASQIGTTVSLGQVGLRDIATANQPEFLDGAVAVPGTAAGDLLPPNVSLCVTLRTALAGRSFRGRSYIWGFTENGNTATGAASASVQTACLAWIDAISSALSAQNLQLAVVSRTRLVTTAMSSRQVRDAVWDTQRKRAIPGI